MKPLQSSRSSTVILCSFLALVSICVPECQAQLNDLADEPNNQEEQSEANPLDSVEDTLPTCSCDCCAVATRRPDEQREGKSDLKCTAKDPSLVKDACPMECKLSIMDAEVVANGETNLQLTDYYCFVQCKPIGLEVGTKCTGMDDKEVKKAQTQDGTGEDIWATPEVLEAPTLPPEPQPMPDLPEANDEPLVIKEPEVSEAAPAPPPPEEKKDDGGGAKDEALAADAKVQAFIKKKEKATEEKATSTEKFALEVRKVMEAPLSPNGFLVQVGIH